jgi:hypothetical protein
MDDHDSMVIGDDAADILAEARANIERLSGLESEARAHDAGMFYAVSVGNAQLVRWKSPEREPEPEPEQCPLPAVAGVAQPAASRSSGVARPVAADHFVALVKSVRRLHELRGDDRRKSDAKIDALCAEVASLRAEIARLKRDRDSSDVTVIEHPFLRKRPDAA